MSESILKVEDLNVELGKEKVLENLSFDLKNKEVLIVLGPNGAGKSVLLRTLLNLHPFKGKIQWRENVHVGYVPENFDVSPNLPLSVTDFLKFKDKKLLKATEALKWVGIKDAANFLDKKLGTLSTGQLKRVIIAWVLIDEPDVLLLDEPMVGIDIRGRETIYDSLVKLWRQKNQSIILVSHEIGEVVKKADRILALNKEKLFFGSPEKVINPKNLAKIYGGSISI